MKKNLLTVLILALLLVNIVLTSVLMFSVMSTNKKTAELVTNIATVMNLELTVPGEEQVTEVSLADTEVYALANSMTVPLKSDGTSDKTTYMVFDVAFSLNMTHDDYETYGGENMATYDSLIKDAVSTVVSSHTKSECEDIETLKAEILEAVQDLFQSDFVYKVSISEPKFG